MGVVFSGAAYIVEVQTIFSKNEFNVETLQLEGRFAATEKADKTQMSNKCHPHNLVGPTVLIKSHLQNPR